MDESNAEAETANAIETQIKVRKRRRGMKRERHIASITVREGERVRYTEYMMRK